MDENVEAFPERVVLGSLELLNGAGCCVVQYRIAVVDSPENQPSSERLF